MQERDPEQCLCTALRQAARRVSHHYDTALAEAGISTNQYSILSRLARNGPHTVQVLATDLVMDRSTLGHLLRPLETRGLVLMASQALDRRRREISLTARGGDLVRHARGLWVAAQRRFEAAYGPDEALALRVDLRRICSTETTHGQP